MKKEEELFTSCEDGHIVKIQKLIKSTLFSKGANVNAKRIDALGKEETPLICAINSGRGEVVKLLISAGACINEIVTNERTKKTENFYSSHRTPLICAIKCNNKEIVELILNAGAKVNVGFSDNANPLICAIDSNNKEIVELLISRGANVNFHFESTPLLSAIKMGNKEMVEFLISKGANVNDKPKGYNHLIYALNANLADIAELLFLKGGEGYTKCDALELTLKNGFFKLAKLMLRRSSDTPREGLEDAFKSNDVELLSLLIDRLDNIFETSSYHESSRWAEYCLPETLRFLISRGVNINKKNSIGNTPLYDAIKFGTPELVDILLFNGADLNIVCNNEHSALYEAILFNKEKIVELLINKYKVDINDDRFGYLALALRVGSDKLAELFLSIGYKSINQTVFNCTPLLFTVNHNFLDILKLLIKHGADVNKTSEAYDLGSLAYGPIKNGENGFTPLHLASQKGYMDIVKCLLENGAYVDCQTLGHQGNFQDCDGGWHPGDIINDGLTPLFFAQQNGHNEIVKLLLEHGANSELAKMNIK